MTSAPRAHYFPPNFSNYPLTNYYEPQKFSHPHTPPPQCQCNKQPTPSSQIATSTPADASPPLPLPTMPTQMNADDTFDSDDYDPADFNDIAFTTTVAAQTTNNVNTIATDNVTPDGTLFMTIAINPHINPITNATMTTDTPASANVPTTVHTMTNNLIPTTNPTTLFHTQPSLFRILHGPYPAIPTHPSQQSHPLPPTCYSDSS
jgi:hypothetical protein